jgi:carboxyl-terminal processing protease
MEFEGYMGVASEEFKALEAKLHPDLDRDLELFKELIKGMIETEIMQRFHYKKGVLLHQLANDKVYHKAIEVLQDQIGYHHVLQPSSRKMSPTNQVAS